MRENHKGERPLRRGGRLHLVLIPGFAGFDALGQLEYYAGVTDVFRSWKSTSGSRSGTVLHYFDNFPTAAVKTRAGRLRRYLAKRRARGEFQDGDAVVLIGHSTGGLDIRSLLWDLCSSPDTMIPVDGTTRVKADDVLRLIDRVAFLSVPQAGTNIAHWMREYVLGRAVVLAQLRASVAASQTPVVRRIQDLVSASAASALNLDLLRAVQDSLVEAEVRNSNPTDIAYAHEAASQLELWLRHMAWDFSAIDDLVPAESPHAAVLLHPTAEDHCSPAQFGESTRSRERHYWEELDIATRSYATVSSSPFRFEPGSEVPIWALWKPWTWPDLTPRSGDDTHTDLTYRWCYRACAGGPFRYPEQHVPTPVPFDGGPPRRLQVWDNDGIVNTQSMLWPNGDETILVDCDHMDIVGHFTDIHAPKDVPGRCHVAYDLMRSGSHFGEATFARVWRNIFDFCESRVAVGAAMASA